MFKGIENHDQSEDKIFNETCPQTSKLSFLFNVFTSLQCYLFFLILSLSCSVAFFLKKNVCLAPELYRENSLNIYTLLTSSPDM